MDRRLPQMSSTAALRHLMWPSVKLCRALCTVATGILAVVLLSTVTTAAAASFQELPAPGSAAAVQLLKNPNTPDDIRDWYTFHKDSRTITEQHTRSFLKQLQQQITSSSSSSSSSSRRQSSNRNLLLSSSSTSSTTDLKPFMKVSKDLLNYLRFQHSTALLPLLRSYSRSNSSSSSSSSSSNLTLSNADLEALQMEIDQALNPAALGRFYKTVSSKCKHYSHQNGAQAGRKLLQHSHHHHRHHDDHHHQQHTRRQLRQISSRPSTSPAPTTAQIFSPNHPQNLEEMLCSISSLSPIGLRGMSLRGIPEDIAQGTESESDSELSSESVSTESGTQGVSVSKQLSSGSRAGQRWQQQGVNRSISANGTSNAQADLGDISVSYDPPEILTDDSSSDPSAADSNDTVSSVTGLDPATLSALDSSSSSSSSSSSNSSSSTNGSRSDSSSGDILCPVQPENVTVPFNIVVPIVFHVLRYGARNGYYMPPIWEDSTTSPLMSAENLIKVANRYYKGTGIQFKVQEVRTDPSKYPYLLVPTKSAWIKCSVHSSDTQWPCNTCLEKIAKTTELAPLFQSYTINIFVSGSASEPLCKDTDRDYWSCSDVARGCSNPVGPWADGPLLKDMGVSANWKSEGSTGVDWVWISYDDFNPDVYNNFDIAWDGGGATVAHEVGHYLGLLHTFDGEFTCDGDGYNHGDKVPDTPASDSAQTYSYYSQQMYQDLSQWCSDFREGGQPDPRSLLRYNTCNAGVYIVGDYISDIQCDELSARCLLHVIHTRPGC